MGKQEFKKAYSIARKGKQYNGFKSCFYQPLYNLGYSKSEVIELLYFKHAPAKDNFGYRAMLANRLPINKESRTFSLLGVSIKIFNY